MKNIFTFLILLLGVALYGQDFTISNPNITSCNGVFYDSGGKDGNYNLNESLTTTICGSSADPSESHLELDFVDVNLALGDSLSFFDGINNTARRIGTIKDNISGAISVRSTTANASGCITVQFSSNGNAGGTGWKANFHCVQSCQNIIATLGNTSPAIVDGTLDICLGQPISFEGQAAFPQEGFEYHQSTELSEFIWDFDDGNVEIGRNITHVYTTAGGYNVTLVVRDTKGCESSTYVNCIVRVAPAPAMNILSGFPNSICPGDTVSLNSDISTNSSYIEVLPSTVSFVQRENFSEELFLPDGFDEYSTKISLKGYKPDARITSTSDIESIFVNMEHSYLLDLGVKLTCPNGSSVGLVDFGGFISDRKVVLGEPLENISNPCDNTVINPGVGFDYSWEENTSKGTWTVEALDLPKNSTLPRGTYQPSNSFDDLIGCPINGDWTLSISDNIACDNGWIFSWGIGLSNAASYSVDSFQANIVDYKWENNSNDIGSTNEKLMIAPSNSGDAFGVFTVTDDFGCQYHDTVSVKVLSPKSAQCLKCDLPDPPIADLSVCRGEALSLDATLGNIEDNITFETNLPLSFARTANVSLDITDMLPTSISSLNKTIKDIEINIDCHKSEDLEIDLISPDNKILRLVNRGDIVGSQHVNARFSSLAITNISSYDGTNQVYRPSGNWSSMNGAVTNGNWKLEVRDVTKNQSKNQINHWNLSLKPYTGLTYQWTGNNIDCDDCADIDIVVNQNENVSVAINDAYGCSTSKSIELKAVEKYAAPSPEVEEMKAGKIYFKWDAVPEILKYKVKVNDSGWIFSSGALNHVVDGVEEGDIVDFQVKSVPEEDIFCDDDIASLRVIYDNCFMIIEAQEQTPVKCFGTPTGAIFVDVLITSVTLPVQYQINGGSFQAGSLFTGLTSGEYFITVKDGDDCEKRDTITLLDPPPVVGNAVATDISCNGLTDGEVTASASGGIYPYTYYWNTSPFTTFDSIAINLGARDYTVTIKDSNNCEVKEIVTVNEPTELTYNSAITNPSCFGGHNGEIELTLAGGTPDYSVVWSTGATSTDLLDVVKGNYSCTVTDASGCTGTESMVVNEPDPVSLPMNTVDILCNGFTTGSATVQPIGKIPFSYNWSNDASINSPNNINIPAGLYNLTVTDDDGCISYSTGTITEPTALTGTMTKVDILCYGTNEGSAEISVSGGVGPYVINWNDNQNQSTAIASNLLAGNYTVTVSDANNCSFEEHVAITEPLALNIVQEQQDISCLGATNGTAKVSISGGVSPYTYKWNDAANQITNEAIGLIEGNYTVSITDANNCMKTVDFEIGILANQLNIESVETTSPVCFGQNNGSISITVSGGESPYQYLWSDPLAQIDKDANFLTGGTYTVTITDAGNCSAIENVVLIQPDQLEGTITKVDVKCKNLETGEASIDVVGGTTPYNYQWNDPAFQIVADAENLPAGIYDVVVHDANNCEITNTVEILEPLSIVSGVVTQDKTGCFGAMDNNLSLVAHGGTPDYVYQWDTGSSDTSVEGVSSGNHSVSITDIEGCQIVLDIDVMELEEISAEFLFIKPTCYGLEDGKIGVNTISGGDGNGVLVNYQYNWGTDPVQNTEIAENLVGDNDYALTITDMSGCYETFELHLKQPEEIEIGYIKNDVNCHGNNDGAISLDDVSGGLPPYNASWGANANNSNNISLHNLEPGSYFVTVSDSKGCSNSDEIEIVEPEEIGIKFIVDNTNCHNNSNGKINTTVAGGTSPYTYVWDNGETTAVLENLTAGDYSLTLSDANGCSQIATQNIEPPYYIGANIHTNPTTCIDTEDGVLKVYPYGGFYPFQISIDEEVYENSEIFSNLAPGEYNVHVKDSLKCVWDTVVVIEHAPEFTFDAGKDIEIFYGDKYEFDLDMTNAVGAPEFEWTEYSSDESLNCHDCKNPIATPQVSEYYDIYAIDENGCEAEDKVFITVKTYRNIEIPSGFSPNGDDKNDKLIVHGKRRFVESVILFQVFDEWGEMVYQDENFKLNDENRGWDGTFRGKEMLPGVYIWRIEVQFADGYKDQFTGQTNLIK